MDHSVAIVQLGLPNITEGENTHTHTQSCDNESMKTIFSSISGVLIMMSALLEHINVRISAKISMAIICKFFLIHIIDLFHDNGFGM